MSLKCVNQVYMRLPTGKLVLPGNASWQQYIYLEGIFQADREKFSCSTIKATIDGNHVFNGNHREICIETSHLPLTLYQKSNHQPERVRFL